MRASTFRTNRILLSPLQRDIRPERPHRSESVEILLSERCSERLNHRREGLFRECVLSLIVILECERSRESDGLEVRLAETLFRLLDRVLEDLDGFFALPTYIEHPSDHIERAEGLWIARPFYGDA